MICQLHGTHLPWGDRMPVVVNFYAAAIGIQSQDHHRDVAVITESEFTHDNLPIAYGPQSNGIRDVNGKRRIRYHEHRPMRNNPVRFGAIATGDHKND